jgi:hypothetical protein
VGLRSQSLNSTNAKQAAGKELITSTINRPQTRSSAGTKVLPISGSSNNKTTGRPPTKPAVLKTRGSKKFSNTSSNISAKSGDRTPERHHSTDDPFDTRADQVSHHVSSSDDESVCDSLSLLSRVAASTSPLSTGTTSQQCVDDASLVNTAADLLGIMDGSESAFGTTSSFHSVTGSSSVVMPALYLCTSVLEEPTDQVSLNQKYLSFDEIIILRVFKFRLQAVPPPVLVE